MCELLQISKMKGTESRVFKCTADDSLSSSNGLNYNGLSHTTEV